MGASTVWDGVTWSLSRAELLDLQFPWLHPRLAAPMDLNAHMAELDRADVLKDLGTSLLGPAKHFAEIHDRDLRSSGVEIIGPSDAKARVQSPARFGWRS